MKELYDRANNLVATEEGGRYEEDNSTIGGRKQEARRKGECDVHVAVAVGIFDDVPLISCSLATSLQSPTQSRII